MKLPKIPPFFKNKIQLAKLAISGTLILSFIFNIVEFAEKNFVPAVIGLILTIITAVWLSVVTEASGKIMKFVGIIVAVIRCLLLLIIAVAQGGAIVVLALLTAFVGLGLHIWLLVLLGAKTQSTTFRLQYGEASVLYQVNSSPLQVCHYSILQGPTMLVRPFLDTTKFFFYRVHWSNPWNVLSSAYPVKNYIIPTHTDSLSARISSLSTVDGKQLYLEIFVFFKVINVNLLTKVHCDPIDALRYYAKECVVAKIYTYTKAEFLENRTSLRNPDEKKDIYKPLISYAESIGIEIKDVYCVDYMKPPHAWIKKKTVHKLPGLTINTKQQASEFGFASGNQKQLDKNDEEAYESLERWEEMFSDDERGPHRKRRKGKDGAEKEDTEEEAAEEKKDE